MALKTDVRSFYEDLFDILEHGYMAEGHALDVLKSVEYDQEEDYPVPSKDDWNSIQGYAVAISEIQSEMVEKMLEDGHRKRELMMLEGNFQEIMQHKLDVKSQFYNNFYRSEELIQTGRLFSTVPDYLGIDAEEKTRVNPHELFFKTDSKKERKLFEAAESIADRIPQMKKKKV